MCISKMFYHIWKIRAIFRTFTGFGQKIYKNIYTKSHKHKKDKKEVL